MTKEEFKNEVLEALKEQKPQDWRNGQFVFNYVDRFFGVAREAQFNHGIDCFYNDNKINDFLDCCYGIMSKSEGTAR